MWLPILICTHWFYCSGEPIKGKPQPSYDECKQVLDLSLALFGRPEFTTKYVISKCERLD